jgi:transposase
VRVPLLLPQYSSDLNLIEQLFSKLKLAKRCAVTRSVQAVHATIAKAPDEMTPKE